MNRMYVLCTSLIFVGLLSPLLTLSARAAESPRILFSEVDWGGSLRGTADEWLELANLGGSSVDLSGWNVIGAGTSSSSLTLPQGSTIPAYGTFLIANYAPSDSSTLSNQADYVTTAVSLPNSTLALSLIDANGLIIDSLVDAGSPDYGSTTPIFSSMERNLSTLLWQNPISSSNLLDATQLGSPGFAEVPIIEPVLISITTEPDSPPPALEELEPDFTITDTITPMPVVTDPIVIPEPISTSDPSQSSALTTDQPIELSSTEPIQSPTDIITNPTELLITSEEPTIPTEPAIPTETPIVVETVTVPAIEPTQNEIIITAPTLDASLVTELIVNSVPLLLTPIIEPVIEPVIAAPTIAEPVTATAVQLEPITTLVTSPTLQPVVGHLILNEFLSSPSTGFDEWIEIYNADIINIDLSGWLLMDASGKTTALVDSILAGSYHTIINPNGKLNNDGDSITLLDASGNIIDTVIYGTTAIPAPAHDQSLSHTGDTWLLSDEVTPNAANKITLTTPIVTAIELITSPVVVDSVPASELATNSTPVILEPQATVIKLASTTTKPTTTAVKKITPDKVVVTKVVTKTTPKKSVKKKTTKAKPAAQLITTLVGVADDILVTYQGTVIATPGTFGKQLAVVNGAMLYMNSADWPTLALGDIITVTGTTSTANGEQRIKLTGASVISIINHVDLQSATDLNSAAKPALVTVHGTVVTRSGSKLTLKVDGHDIIVDAYKTTGIIWSSLTSSELTITGILRHLNNEDVLMPRTVADVVANQTAVIAAIASTQHSIPIPLKPIAGGGLVASTLGALGYWFTKSRTLIPAV